MIFFFCRKKNLMEKLKPIYRIHINEATPSATGSKMKFKKQNKTKHTGKSNRKNLLKMWGKKKFKKLKMKCQFQPLFCFSCLHFLNVYNLYNSLALQTTKRI